MRVALLTCCFFSLFTIRAFSQQWAWAQHTTGTDMVQVQAVAADAFGNVYTAGCVTRVSNSTGPYTLSAGSQTYTRPASAGGFSYLIKYNGAGQALWIRTMDWVSKILMATDAAGNLFMAGQFNSSTLKLGNITVNMNGATSWAESPFLAKFDSSGSAIWARVPQLGNTLQMNLCEGRADALTTDNLGNVIFTGNYKASSISFDGKTLNNSFSTPSAYRSNAFIVKYNSSGAVQWAQQVAGSNWQIGCAGAATDAAGNVLIGGKFFAGTISLGSFSLSNHDSNSMDVFVAKLSPAGTFLWANRAGGNYYDVLNGAATDAAGNLYICGHTQSNPANFDAFTTHMKGGSIASDIFLAKYDNVTGACRWVRSEGGSCVDNAGSVVTFGNDHVYLAGSMGSGNTHTSTFGSFTVANPNNFIVQYDTAGTALCVHAYDPEAPYEIDIATTIQDQLYVLGSYNVSNYSLGSSQLPLSGTSEMYLGKYTCGTVNHIMTASTGGPAIYPNPASDAVQIDGLSADTDYRLLNAMGAVVREGHLRPGGSSLSLKDVPPGLYLLTLHGEDGNRFAHRLIKQ